MEPSIIIDGEWINPVTKHRFFFYTAPFDTSSVCMSIVQCESDEPITFDATRKDEEDYLLLKIEGAEYPVEVSNSFSCRTLQIAVAAGIFIRLDEVKVPKTQTLFSAYSIL